MRVVACLLVRSVPIPSVLHKRPWQKTAGRKIVIRIGVHARIGRGDQEHLVSDLRAIPVLSHKRQRCGHISTNRIARDRNAAAISTELASMCGDPLYRCVAFLQRSREFPVGEGRVFDKNADLARADNEVAQQSLMVLEIADNPDSTMNKKQNARRTLTLLRRHDIEVNCTSVLRDGLLNGTNAGHVDSRLVLQPGEDLLWLRLGQFPERAAVLV